MINTLVTNFLGGPGVSKSTTAAYCFAKLKEAGINAEYVQEYAKDVTWSDHSTVLNCQPYITGKQFWRMARLRDKVEVVVTDSPIITGLLYPSWGCSPDWEKGVVHQFNMFNNINILLKRNTDVHPYQEHGRSQKEDKAKEIDDKTRLMLEIHKIPFTEINVDTLDRTWQKMQRILIDRGVPLKAEAASMI